MKITDEAVEAATGALSPTDASAIYPDAMHAALEAAAPFLMAQAWDVCAGVVEAATRLVAPDEITPMGARVINAAAAHNPYRKGE